MTWEVLIHSLAFLFYGRAILAWQRKPFPFTQVKEAMYFNIAHTTRSRHPKNILEFCVHLFSRSVLPRSKNKTARLSARCGRYPLSMIRRTPKAERATSSYEDSQVRQYFKNKQRKNRQSQGFGQGSLHASVHSGVKLHRVAETALINIADETG